MTSFMDSIMHIQVAFSSWPRIADKNILSTQSCQIHHVPTSQQIHQQGSTRRIGATSSPHTGPMSDQCIPRVTDTTRLHGNEQRDQTPLQAVWSYGDVQVQVHHHARVLLWMNVPSDLAHKPCHQAKQISSACLRHVHVQLALD